MATTNKRFVAKNGLDNNGNTITNVGASGNSLGISGTGDLTITISGTATLTVPAGSDTLVTLTGTQTLTNKTLTTPVIATISNTGTLTLPTSTDTLVGRATTDTLTNKTISGSNNTLSNIGNSSLTNSSVSYNGVSVALGASGTLYTDDISEDGTPVNLWFTNTRARNAVSATDAGGDGSFTYDSGTGVFTYTGPSATEVRAHLSAGTGLTYSSGQFAIDSTVATLTGTQTLTNKTISGADNTLSNIGNSSLTNSSITINGTSVSLGGTRTLVTDDIAEDGSPSNLWYTDTRSRTAISVTDSGGDGSLSYNSGSGVITYTGPSASEVRAHFSAGTGVAISSGQISIGQAVATTDNVTFAGVTADNIRVGVTAAGEIDTSSGNLTLDSTGGTTVMDDDVNVTGNLLVDGNLTVSGTTVTINTTNLAVEDNMIYLNNGSTVSNPDLGFAGNYNDGTYRHAGIFRDASDGVWKFYHQYTPEPDASAYIDITHGSFALAAIQAASFTGSVTGNVTGNASTATAWQTARTLTLSGDVTGTSAAFDGSGNISITTTIAADSVALGTDTTGNYVASITNGSYITGADGGSEGAGLTLAVDATSANTASKVVARDSSGNFAAGTITAALSGNASTATTLQTARNINGVSFNGSADITVADSTKLPLTGGTISGSLSITGALNVTGSKFYTVSNNSGESMELYVDAGAGASEWRHIYGGTGTGYGVGVGGYGIYYNGGADYNVIFKPDGATEFKYGTVTITGNQVLHSGNYSSYALPLSGGTVSGFTTFTTANDTQIQLSGGTTAWAGISFNDVNGTDYLWFNGAASTWSFGGSGSSSGGKKVHVHGGVTIGSGYVSTAAPTNGLLVEGAIQQGGNQVLHAGNYSSYALPLSGGTMTGTATFAQGANITFGSSTNEAGPWTISINGSGGATPATKGTGYGRNLIIVAGASDNSSGLAGGDLFLRGGAPTAPSTVYGDVRIANLGGQVYLRSGAVAIGSDNYTSYTSFAGDVSATGQGRFTGWYTGNAATGLAAEIGVFSGRSYILSYNRNTSSYAGLTFAATEISLEPQSGNVNVATGALQQGGNQVLHAGNYTSYPTTFANLNGGGVGYREDYSLGFRPSGAGSYAGFRFASPGNDANAGYFLIRGGADNDVYTENGLTIVADLGWLTLAQRTTAGKGVRIMTGTTSTERITVLAAGQVGIGTTSPVFDLSVSGVIQALGAGTDSVASGPGSIYLGNGSAGTMLRHTASRHFAIDTYSSSNVWTERVRVERDGNVGIGTASPGGRLQVSAETSTQQMLLVRNFATGSTGSFTGNYVAEIRSVYTTGATGGALLVHTQEASDSRPTMAVSDSNGVFATFVNGKVGIGTTSPNALLVAKASGNYGTIACDNSTTTGGGAFAVRKQGSAIGYLLNKGSWFGDTTNDLCVAAETGYNVRIYTNGSASEKFIFTTGGSFGIGTTSPQATLDVRGGILRTNTRVTNDQNYPVGHYTPGDVVFEIDPTWTQAELQEFFGTSGVSWVADSTAPGGYAIDVGNSVYVGGNYNSGFPYIPVDQDDTFYMECWIRNTSGSNAHYMGSIDYNESFSSLGGNPGSFGYWVMLNTNPGSSWTKVSGYIKGFGGSTGQFVSGTKYWTPQALFNYSGGGTCRISGWKAIKVSQPGEKIFKAAVGVNMTARPSYALHVTGDIYATSNITAYSDARAKENIITIEDALNKVINLRGVYYNKINESEKNIGVIAQEVLKVVPELVSYAKDIDEYSVKYQNITALLIEAIKELKKQLDEVKSQKH